MNEQVYLHLHSCFTTIDQVRLWLACGELDQATRWAQKLELKESHFTPLARERQEVARARILLAQDQPAGALQRLEPALQRATAGQRWGHVIEIRLLQALAHQRLDEEAQALAALSEAVRLGEPEGYIRSFVEEGEALAVLLCKLREEQPWLGQPPISILCLPPLPKKANGPNVSSSRADQGGFHEPIHASPEPASGYQVLSARSLGDGHPAFSAAFLAQ